MHGNSLAEQLAAAGQAIKCQQQVATNLAGALADLVVETERMAAHMLAPNIVAKELSDEQPQEGETDKKKVVTKELSDEQPQVDLHPFVPGIPEQLTDDVFPPVTPPPLRGCSKNSGVPEPIPEPPTDDPPVTSPSPPLRGWSKISASTPSQLRSQIVPRRNFGDRLEDLVKECADELSARKKHETHGHMFADPERMRDQIREHLTDDTADVHQLYKETGLCQSIVRSAWFETASMILVIVSSLWIAVEIDHNHSDALHQADTVFQVVAHLLCLLFFIEILIRIYAFRRLRHAMKDGWIVFDFVLVVLFVLEVWVLATAAAIADWGFAGSGMKLIIVFRVLRLLRILRLARVVRHLPELMVIINGLGLALRAILVVLLLIGLNIYVAAIVFKALLDGSTLGRERFPSVSTSMGTLALDCTLSGSRGTAIMREAWDVHPIFGILMMLFVLVTNVTMLGVLTGLMVQTVKTVAEMEKEQKSAKQLVSTMQELWKLMSRGDIDNDGKIDMDEFVAVMTVKETARVMRELNVDVEGLASLSAFVFEQHNGRLGRKEFLQMVLDVRNSNVATVKDHIETRKFVQAAVIRTFNKAIGGGVK